MLNFGRVSEGCSLLDRAWFCTKIMNPAPFMGKLINDFNRGQNLSFQTLEEFSFAGNFLKIWPYCTIQDVSNLVVLTNREIVITLKNSFRTFV